MQSKSENNILPIFGGCLVVMLLIAGLFYVVSLLWNDASLFIEKNKNYIIWPAAIVSVLLIAAFLYTYLQKPFIQSIQKVTESRVNDSISQRVNDSILQMESLVKELRTELTNVREKVPAINFENFDTEKLLKVLSKKIDKDFAASVVQELDNRLQDVIESGIRQNTNDGFQSIKDRLKTETYTISRRANINLILGSLTTLGSIGVLAYAVWGHPTQLTTMEEVLAFFIPRISVVIFAEIFAFFFLRLYKVNLADLKYFQNELTNVEMRELAVLAAMPLKDEEIMKGIVAILSNTERNFVLKKDETTIHAEKYRIDSENEKTYIEMIKEIIKPNAPK